MRLTERASAVASHSLVLCLFAVHASAYVRFTQDDTYITLRYARNLANGLGLVFNPGERVEGYSCPSYVLLLAALDRLGLDPVGTAKGIGIISSLVTIAFVFRFSFGRRTERLDSFPLAAALLAASPSFALWSVMGMETPVYGALIIAAAYHALNCSRSPSSGVFSAALFLLVAVTRPEGVIFFVLTLAWRLTLRREGWGTADTLSTVSFVGLFGAFLAWRLWYFGDLLPNTYYAKSGFGILGKARGLKYVYEFFRAYGGPTLIFFALVSLAWKDRPAWVNYLLLLTTGQLAFTVWVGGDNMAQFRFMTPILPFLCLLVEAGIKRLARELSEERIHPTERSRAGFAAAVAALMVCLFGSFGAYTVLKRHPAFFQIGSDDPISDASRLVPVAEWLRARAPGGARIAVGEAGVIPYVTGWRTLDGFGLTDPAIARAPRIRDERGVLKKDPAFIVKRILDWHPDFVEFFATPGFDTITGFGGNLLWNELVAHGYEPAAPYDKMPGMVILERRHTRSDSSEAAKIR